MSLRLNSISLDCVHRLTFVLRLLPDADALEYSNWVLSYIKTLPAPLKRKSGLSSLFGKGAEKSLLCELHSLLKSPLVDALYRLLLLECSDRLQDLAVHAALLPPNQQDRVRRIQERHQAFMRSDLFSTSFGAAASSRFSFQSNRCPACCIARLVTSPEFLLDLLIVAQSRYDDNQGPATIARYLHSFLCCYTKDLHSQTFMKLFAAVEEETTALRESRETIRLIRTESGLEEVAPLPQSCLPPEAETEPNPAGAGATTQPCNDAVMSIVNLYDNFRSSQRLPMQFDRRPTVPEAGHADIATASNHIPAGALCPTTNRPSSRPPVKTESDDSGYETVSFLGPKKYDPQAAAKRASGTTIANRRLAYEALVGPGESVDNGVADVLARSRADTPDPRCGNGDFQTQAQARNQSKYQSSYRPPRSNTSSVYSQPGLSTYITDVPLYLDRGEIPPALPPGR